MSGAVMFDRQMLEIAFSEIEAVRRTLPETALIALAEEVVNRVARNLRDGLSVDIMPSSEEIDLLCDALLSTDPRAAAAFIETARLKGHSYDAICHSYLSAAARRLGDWWDEDRVSFHSVTIAAGRIYGILRILRLERPQPTPDFRRVAVFASVPGENHTLGITMATDLARNKGWDIDLFVGLSHEDLVERLDQRLPVVIALSASGKRSLPALTRLIVAVRICNPNARILICGQIVSANLALVGVTGADATAADFDTAIHEMERLLNIPTGRLI